MSKMAPISRSTRRRLPSQRRRALAVQRLRFRRKLRQGGAPLVHRFAEWFDGGDVTVAALSTGAGIQCPQLASLLNVTNLRGLFDLYKITGMKVTFIPIHNVSDFSTGTGSGIPMLYVAPNRDPYVPAPSTVGDILNDDGVKIIRFTKPVSFYLKNPKPDIRDSVGNNLPFQLNSTLSALQPWLTTGGNSQLIDQSTVKYYGLRWFVDNVYNSAQPFTFKTHIKLYVSCKEQD